MPEVSRTHPEADRSRAVDGRQPRRSSTARAATPGPIWARVESRRDASLSRPAIVAAALRIADAEGLAAVSIRRVASELDAGAMSLYTHVPSKDDLLDLMFDELIGEARQPVAPQADWRTALTEITQRKRALCLRHPWAVQLYGRRPLLGPNAMRLFEEALSALRGLPVDPATAWRVICAVDDYTLGFVQRESVYGQAARRRGSALADWEAAIRPYLQQIIDSGEFPLLSPLLAEGVGGAGDAEFQRGLDWLLDGIASQLPGG